MKSKLTIFIIVTGLILFSLLKVNAEVKAPPEPNFPLETSPSSGSGSSPEIIAPYPIPAPDEPVQKDPNNSAPVSFFIEPATPSRTPINKTPLPEPVNLNNYDIFGNNSGPDYRLLLVLCCLCLCCPGLVVLLALGFVLYKQKGSVWSTLNS
ncbi:MAG: hypothetical protein ACMG57_03865 [Candidatus Dojkabacteria bacterium]